MTATRAAQGWEGLPRRSAAVAPLEQPAEVERVGGMPAYFTICLIFATEVNRTGTQLLLSGVERKKEAPSLSVVPIRNPEGCQTRS